VNCTVAPEKPSGATEVPAAGGAMMEEDPATVLAPAGTHTGSWPTQLPAGPHTIVLVAPFAGAALKPGAHV
jgi:hypothetical protein